MKLYRLILNIPKIGRMPLKELKGFKRVSVTKGADKQFQLNIPINDLQKWDMGTPGWKIYPGDYKLVLGGKLIG